MKRNRNRGHIKTPFNFAAKRGFDMTSGRFRYGRCLCGGFTFIELILVILLIGVVVGLAAPRLSTAWHALRTDSFVYDMARLLTTLGERSVAESKVYRLVFDDDRSSYWVERSAGEEHQVRDKQKFKRVKGVYGRKQRVPGHVRLTQEGDTPAFFPSGEQSFFTIHISQDQHTAYTLTTQGVYGQVALTQVLPETLN